VNQQLDSQFTESFADHESMHFDASAAPDNAPPFTIGSGL